MISFDCPHCQAHFDLDPAQFPSGTAITCGNCGAALTVPEVIQPVTPTIQPAAAPPPPQKPAASPPRRSAPAANAPARKPAGGASQPPMRKAPGKASVKAPGKAAGGAARKRPAPVRKAGPDPRLLYGGIGGGVLLVIVLLLVVGGGSTEPNDTGGEGSGAGTNGNSTAEEVVDPFDAAYEKARRSGAPDDLEALGAMAFDLMEEATDGTPAFKKARSRMRFAYRELLKADADHPVANERMGNIAFDAAEVEAWLANPALPADLREDLSFEFEIGAEEHLTADKRKTWISTTARETKEFAKSWTAMRTRVLTSLDQAKARESDPFYERARALGRSEVRALRAHMGEHLTRGDRDDPFHVHIDKPYVLIIEKDRNRGDHEKLGIEWARVLTDLDRNFRERYSEGIDELTTPRPRVVIGLRDSAQYALYLDPKRTFSRITNSAAHFEPYGTKRIVTPIGQQQGSGKSPEDLSREVLFHEGTHQIVDAYMTQMARNHRAAKTAQGLWFSEGIAEFFGAHGLKGFDENNRRVYDFGLLLPSSIATIAAARKGGDALTVAQLLDYSRGRYNTESQDPTKSLKVGIAYAQGWSLCYLLQQHRADKYGDKFAKYFAAEMRGRSGRRAFEEVFGAGSVAEVQRDLDAMMDELEKAAAEGKIRNGKLVK